MSKETLKDRCKVNTNYNTDTFVGIKTTQGDVVVSFPLGFRLSDDERNLRKDILLLLNVLSNTTYLKESRLNNSIEQVDLALPVYSYLYVITDYYSRGIFKETESVNEISKYGKINWNKTIKTQKPYISGDDIIYLDYITSKHCINENEMITLIHEYCVYESFDKLGWLFTSSMPPKPRVKLNKKNFSRTIKKKLDETYNDRNRQLFRHLLAIIEYLSDDKSTDFRYGTNRFEYIWEVMIDRAYGISNKIDYFPSTKWIIEDELHDNSYLKPDTIMLARDNIYVMDAKYYKYGWTKSPEHLPDSESINKQITYGEYIAESTKFLNHDGKHPKVLNAFIMPYDAWGETFHTEETLHHVGNAISNWKSSDGTKPYERVVGILIDIKTLMSDYSRDNKKIIEMAELIEKSIHTQ